MNKLEIFANAAETAFNQLGSEFLLTELDVVDGGLDDKGSQLIMFLIERNRRDLGVLNLSVDKDFNNQQIGILLRDSKDCGAEHMCGASEVELPCCNTLAEALEWLKSLKYEDYDNAEGDEFTYAIAA